RAANYITVEASNGAVLDVLYDPKLNIRPWDKTLMIRVMRGFLREGDTITVRFGDRRQGSPGMRVQTFVEPTFEFRVLVDAFATCDYVELPIQTTISIVAGPPVTWKAILPTLRRIGEEFRLGFKGEDKWGNPSDRVEGVFSLGPIVRSVAFRKPFRWSAARTPNRSRAYRWARRETCWSRCLIPPARCSASATPCASRPRRRCDPIGAICTDSRRKRSAPIRRGS